MTEASIPAWFWDTLESARPNLQTLATLLEHLPREKLIDFAAFFIEASQEICDYWDGPTVDGIGFSEDDTEDLCNWIVGQGKSLWDEAIASRSNLEPMVRLYWASEENASANDWINHVDNPEYQGYQSPEYIAFAVFRTRFAEELRHILEERNQA